MAAARSVRGWALAHLGDLEAARELYRVAMDEVDDAGRGEILLEAAEIEVWYGERRTSRPTFRMRPLRLVDAISAIRPVRVDDSGRAAIRERRLELESLDLSASGSANSGW